MEDHGSPKLESEASSKLKSETQLSKKGKMVQKKVVMVRVGENVSKLKNEGMHSDFLSWRKYGQKPIKGSPYPRGYYRCSTGKGCSAKKQVERCKTDATMLIVTYTSNHNHPVPVVLSTTDSVQQPKESESETETKEDLPATSKVDDQEWIEEQMNHDLGINCHQATNDENFHYLRSPICCSEYVIIDQDDPFKLNIENPLLEEEPLCSAHLKNFSIPKPEELDIFDELEELPMSSTFLNFTMSNFLNERIPVAPF
ncbi:hypothetical protein RIF29_24815 [Crotalaria pallida]|uniref:WRKY domain-containing protein n=1 Tax=Crotalaria pallida TaxID=3830 RepID=A0AAN9EQJ8_CROPI